MVLFRSLALLLFFLQVVFGAAVLAAGFFAVAIVIFIRRSLRWET
jgi:hypothetical protein